MSNPSSRSFLVGAALGGLFGGAGGYVLNDLTERENPEVVAEIEAQQALQDDLDDFFQNLATQSPADAAVPAVTQDPVPSTSSTTTTN